MARPVRYRTPLLGALACLALWVAPAVAQRVEVEVRSESGPLSGAMVELRLTGGQIAAAAITNDNGRVRFRQVPPGTYGVSAELIGHTSVRVVLDHGEHDSRVDVTLSPAPISLSGLDVTSERRCVGVEAGDEALGLVWDEVRKVLSNASLTQEEQAYRFTTLSYERDLDRDLRQTTRLSEERRDRNVVRPYITRSPGELAVHGFVDRSGTEETYFAPDARLLVSDVFLAGHCMWVRPRGLTAETADLVGLAFAPTSRRPGVVDVSGTLWLDPTGPSLEWLDFRYTNLEGARADSRVGGRVDYTRLDAGRWIVSAWWLRTPTLAAQRGFDDDMLTFLAGFRETGGVVLETEGRAGSVQTAALGSLEGRVLVPNGGSVTIDLSGSGRSQTTDLDGRFAFVDLVPGLYQLLIDHPSFDDFALPPALRAVRVEGGQRTALDLEVDPPGRVRSACAAEIPSRPDGAPAGAWPPGESSVIVHLMDADGEPVVDQVVEIEWATHQVGLAAATELRRGGGSSPVAGRARASNDVPVTSTVTTSGLRHQGRTDAEGRLRFCGLPENQRLVVTGVLGDGRSFEAEARTERVPGPSVVRISAPDRRPPGFGPLPRNGNGTNR